MPQIKIIQANDSNNDITQTRVASVHKDANDIVVIVMKGVGVIDEEDITDLNLVIRNHAGKKAIYKLLDARANFDMNKKAKILTEKEERISKTKARAIVVSNSIKASLNNFFKEFTHDKYPQQFFSDYDQAYRWLIDLKLHSKLDF